MGPRVGLDVTTERSLFSVLIANPDYTACGLVTIMTALSWLTSTLVSYQTYEL